MTIIDIIMINGAVANLILFVFIPILISWGPRSFDSGTDSPTDRSDGGKVE